MTTKGGKYKQAVQEGSKETPLERQRHPTECIADGCPLPGVMRLSNDTSICAAHDGMPAHLWPRITEKVNRVEGLCEVALAGRNASPRVFVGGALEQKFVLELGPAARAKTDETVRSYSARMFGMLVAQCRPHLEAPNVLAEVKRDSWQKANNLV